MRNNITRYLLAFSLLALPPSAEAENFYGSSKRGWFWFETKVGAEAESREPEARRRSASNPLQQLTDFQAELELRKAAMIMQPSLDNTKQYIAMQNKMFMKASLVSQNWQKALIVFPELNIVKNAPISESGLEITRNLEDQRNLQALRSFGKDFSLLFFYTSGCPYCEKFADVVDYFSRKYGYKVMPVTLDGKPLRGGPLKGLRGIYDRNLVQKLNVQSTPSLFAFSNDKGVIVPISHGFLSVDLLERNVLVAKKIVDNHEIQ